MTFRRPSPQDEPAPLSDSENSERTIVQPVARGEGSGAAVAYILERGVESQGSAPRSFVGGQQEGPISLGRGGQFRVDGRGVLATHAYLMFDGDGLYLCSADEANPVVVDGARIPRQWTRVGVPCTLLLGRTRAVLRRATSAAPGRPVPLAPPARPSGDVHADDVHADDGDDTPIEGVPAYQSASPSPDEDTDRPRLPSESDEESTRVGLDILNRPSLRPASEAESDSPAKPQDASPQPARGAPQPLEATVIKKATRASVATRAGDWLRVGLHPGSRRRTPLFIATLALVAAVVMATVTALRLRAASIVGRGAARAAPAAEIPRDPPAGAAPSSTAVSAGIIVYPAPLRAHPEAAEPVIVPHKGKPQEPLAATLERTAVDAVNRGDLGGALVIYRQLAAQESDNPAFANAVRIIQERLASGSGVP